MFNMNPYANYNLYNSQFNTLIRVNGVEGAKAYQMNPNSTVALFDANDDLLYIKNSDGAGFSTVRTFRFTEEKPETKQSGFVTRKDMEEYVKQLISEQYTTEHTTEDEL